MRNRLTNIIKQYYEPSDYPALNSQISEWNYTKPLLGLDILDATPVFRNTLVKHIALLSSGANLSIGISDSVPHDPKIVSLLRGLGIPIILNKYNGDLILDCAASFRTSNAKIGYIELTRSGVEKYKEANKPVFVADSGEIKKIETSLGTGESFFRVMSQMGYNDWSGKTLVVCGSGKVGKGIISYGLYKGAKIIVITAPSTISNPNVEVVDYTDRALVRSVINSAYAVVTATGVKDALKDIEINDIPLLANMGIEDEFGFITPSDRVLNNKIAINFKLEEPTHLKYIDATMALHNEGAIYLATNLSLPKTLITPPQNIEERIIKVTKLRGKINEELKAMLY